MNENKQEINKSSSHGSILSEINNPKDLKKLEINDLPQVCDEIRAFLIEHLSQTPGHFGSSMGAVDIIVALHYVFDAPKDRIVWDVGHQAYAHKILTGRREKFYTLRSENGISGFPTPAESEYDTFVCGHAGNSISAALGMAISDQQSKDNSDRKTIAVIGDASISGGLAFEGLNNASNNPNNLLIILNDNDMSIDDNVGALHHYLSNITTSAPYNRLRFKIYNLLKKIGIINDHRKGLLLRFSNSIKSLIATRQNLFDGLNIRYFGPFNGNDVTKVVKVLNDIKDMSGPKILHLRTVKGKGYAAAEKDPGAWHAPGNFIPEEGVKISSSEPNYLWQDVFGEALVQLADQNKDILGITAAMLSGTSMNKMMEKYPSRTFDVGISEGHAVTFAGGLAATGKKPFVAIYSSFLQRAYDNIIHDVAIQQLPVTFCIDRAGVVGEDGVTHHGLLDIAYLRGIPGLYLASPMNASQLRNLLKTAEHLSKPIAIRYPRGKAIGKFNNEMTILPVGKGEKVVSQEGAKVAILAYGPITNNAIEAANNISNSTPVDIYNMIWAKPLDEEILQYVANNYDYVITIEDGVVTGGFGSAILEWYNNHNINMPIKILGHPDNWLAHASINSLFKQSGIHTEGIAKEIADCYK